MKLTNLLAAGAALTVMAGAANANVIYQSIPDLTVNPDINAWCSQCGGDLASVGQIFTLGSAATVKSVLFDVQSNYAWPTSVTVGIYVDAGGSVGANVYNQTFSTFASQSPTGFNTVVVGVNIGTLSLAAGTYDIFFTNTADLGIPGYKTGSGFGIDTYPVSSYPLLTSDPYHSLPVDYGGDAGVALLDTAIAGVPEPATWAMMLVGVGAIGGAMRSTRRKVSAAA